MANMNQPAPKPCIDDIPRADLIAMLKDAAWCSGGRHEYGDAQGFSYDVDEQTSIRDVVYRDEVLYATPEEAMLAHWKRRFAKNKS